MQQSERALATMKQLEAGRPIGMDFGRTRYQAQRSGNGSCCCRGAVEVCALLGTESKVDPGHDQAA